MSCVKGEWSKTNYSGPWRDEELNCSIDLFLTFLSPCILISPIHNGNVSRRKVRIMRCLSLCCSQTPLSCYASQTFVCTSVLISRLHLVSICQITWPVIHGWQTTSKINVLKMLRTIREKKTIKSQLEGHLCSWGYIETSKSRLDGHNNVGQSCYFMFFLRFKPDSLSLLSVLNFYVWIAFLLPPEVQRYTC